MPAPARNAKCSLALVMLVALSITARAADTSPPAAPAEGPPPPSPAAIAAADTILADTGIKQSIALVVPAMMTELERNVTKTSA